MNTLPPTRLIPSLSRCGAAHYLSRVFVLRGGAGRTAMDLDLTVVNSHVELLAGPPRRVIAALPAIGVALVGAGHPRADHLVSAISFSSLCLLPSNAAARCAIPTPTLLLPPPRPLTRGVAITFLSHTHSPLSSIWPSAAAARSYSTLADFHVLAVGATSASTPSASSSSAAASPSTTSASTSESLALTAPLAARVNAAAAPHSPARDDRLSAVSTGSASGGDAYGAVAALLEPVVVRVDAPMFAMRPVALSVRLYSPATGARLSGPLATPLVFSASKDATAAALGALDALPLPPALDWARRAITATLRAGTGDNPPQGAASTMPLIPALSARIALADVLALGAQVKREVAALMAVVCDAHKSGIRAIRNSLDPGAGEPDGCFATRWIGSI